MREGRKGRQLRFGDITQSAATHYCQWPNSKGDEGDGGSNGKARGEQHILDKQRVGGQLLCRVVGHVDGNEGGLVWEGGPQEELDYCSGWGRSMWRREDRGQGGELLVATAEIGWRWL